MLAEKPSSSSDLNGGDALSVEKTGTAELVVDIGNADDVRLAELGYKGEFRREFSVGAPPSSMGPTLTRHA